MQIMKSLFRLIVMDKGKKRFITLPQDHIGAKVIADEGPDAGKAAPEVSAAPEVESEASKKPKVKMRLHKRLCNTHSRCCLRPKFEKDTKASIEIVRTSN